VVFTCHRSANDECARIVEFVRDLIDCTDWRDRENDCVLSKDEIISMINLVMGLVD